MSHQQFDSAGQRVWHFIKATSRQGARALRGGYARVRGWSASAVASQTTRASQVIMQCGECDHRSSWGVDGVPDYQPPHPNARNGGKSTCRSLLWFKTT